MMFHGYCSDWFLHKTMYRLFKARPLHRLW